MFNRNKEPHTDVKDNRAEIDKSSGSTIGNVDPNDYNPNSQLNAAHTERKTDNQIYIMPDGVAVRAYEMVGKDVNLMMGDKRPTELFYQMLEEGCVVDPDGQSISYNPRRQWLANNFACLTFRRRITIGDDFVFPVKCSSKRCNHGKPKKGGKREFFELSLADTIKDPISGEEIANPYRVQLITWDSPDTPAEEGKGADRKSGRFLVSMPKSGETMVMRLLKGGKDDQDLQKIQELFHDIRATENLRLRCVGLLKDFPDPNLWRTAENVVKPSTDWFINDLNYLDMERLNLAYEKIEGGINTELDVECPLCDSRIVNLDNAEVVPLLSRNFFSSKYAITGQ